MRPAILGSSPARAARPAPAPLPPPVPPPRGGPPPVPAAPRGLPAGGRAVLVSLRPRQWIKNVFVFGGLIFAQKLFTPSAWIALAAFTVFCALSGAVYLLNDVADRERDRLHPSKRLRPIASGRLGVPAALAVAVGLVAASAAAAVWISAPFALVAMAYVALLAAYSAWLKHLVIVDVLTVASGFVLRAVAGALAIEVAISGWLIICTMLLALFLALGKRRHECLTLEGAAARHRPILSEYSAGLLDQMIAVVTASTVTAYALYTMSPEIVARFHTQLLPVTLPFVLYGIFRYLYLLYRRQLGGSPSDVLLGDRALLVNTGLWLAAVLLIIYGTRGQ
jgi:4-hydroxybenzoate polyprenyltransferase